MLSSSLSSESFLSRGIVSSYPDSASPAPVAAANGRLGKPGRSIEFTAGRLPGCYVLELPCFRDARGLLVKTLQSSAFAELGLECDFRESFFTASGVNVLRGMHFQLPPADHAKLIYCISGAICDVALDLRVGSPRFGEHETYLLSEQNRRAIYLPRGIAHGFQVQSALSIVAYQVTTEHSACHDTGVHWDSFGAAWPVGAPVVSERDRGLVRFAEFDSPFRFEDHGASNGQTSLDMIAKGD